MPIDLADVLEVRKKHDQTKPPKVEYRMLSQSDGWRQFSQWVTERRENAEKRSQEAVLAIKSLREYNADILLNMKSLLDITQGELSILQMVEQKLADYQKEERDT